MSKYTRREEARGWDEKGQIGTYQELKWFRNETQRKKEAGSGWDFIYGSLLCRIPPGNIKETNSMSQVLVRL